MTPSPVRDEKAEAWLTKRGVKFTGPRWVSMDDIKRAESRQNQARADALIPEVVDRYTNVVKAGEEFPPIVVHKSGKGFRIIDGNHRDEGYLRGGRTQIGAYTVADDTPSDLIELLTVEANTRHGQPTDTGWRVTQALHLLATGHAPELVYEATGVTKALVSNARRAAKADTRARRLNIYGWDGMSQTAKVNLSSIQSDPVFRAAGELILDYGISTDGLKDVMRAIREATTEAEALAAVAAIREARIGKKKGRREPLSDPRNQVLSALGKVRAINPQELPRHFPSDWDRKEVAARCADAALVLMEMEEVLRRALTD